MEGSANEQSAGPGGTGTGAQKLDRAHSITQPRLDSNVDYSADQQLAAYILRQHLSSLQSAWELAVCRSLSRLNGELSLSQAAVLESIWRRLQHGRAA